MELNGKVTQAPDEVPSLDALADDAALAVGLPPEAIARLSARCGAVTGALQAAAALHRPKTPEQDRLVSADEAAAILGVSREWLYRRAKRLGLTVPLTTGTVRYSRKAINDFIAARRSHPVRTKKPKPQLPTTPQM